MSTKFYFIPKAFCRRSDSDGAAEWWAKDNVNPDKLSKSDKEVWKFKRKMDTLQGEVNKIIIKFPEKMEKLYLFFPVGLLRPRPAVASPLRAARLGI